VGKHRDGLFENQETNMKTKAKAKLRANDLARTIRADDTLGDTLWLVEWIGDRGHCVIREADNPRAGGREFDTSLLQKVDTGRKAA
jgi:hypothetical protein